MAAGLAPLLVLMAFTLIVSGSIGVDTGMAVFAASTVWVIHELHVFQRSIDEYNDSYASRHLAWRTSAMLQDWMAQHTAHLPTREFVGRYLAAERAVLRDGQQP